VLSLGNFDVQAKAFPQQNHQLLCGPSRGRTRFPCAHGWHRSKRPPPAQQARFGCEQTSMEPSPSYVQPLLALARFPIRVKSLPPTGVSLTFALAVPTLPQPERSDGREWPHN
jgi:hypothetical protein